MKNKDLNNVSKWKLTIPSWLPNYREESQFSHTTSHVEWGWEFLRRNPCYQNDFNLWNKRAEEVGKKYKLYGGDEDGISIKDPAFKKITVISGLHMQFTNRLIQKYHLKGLTLLDPALKFEDQPKASTTCEAPYLNSLDSTNFPGVYLPGLVPKFPFQMASLLDARVSKEKYMEFQSNLYDQKRAELEEKNLLNAKRARASNYKIYLRILDAFQSNESTETISHIIFPTEDNSYPTFAVSNRVRKIYKAAILLRDSDYRFLIQDL